MNEIKRLVSGTVALRIVENEGAEICQIFESGNWVALASSELSQRSFNRMINQWLDEHYKLKNNGSESERAESNQAKVRKTVRKRKPRSLSLGN